MIAGTSAHAFTDKSTFTQPLKIALNTYSFNKPLTEGTMDLDDVLEFSAKNQFYACDATAYYFPGYPEVPDDEIPIPH